MHGLSSNARAVGFGGVCVFFYLLFVCVFVVVAAFPSSTLQEVKRYEQLYIDRSRQLPLLYTV